MRHFPPDSLDYKGGKEKWNGKESSIAAESSKTNIRAVPDPEVMEKAVRRKFTAAYKLRIVKEAQAFYTPKKNTVVQKNNVNQKNAKHQQIFFAFVKGYSNYLSDN